MQISEADRAYSAWSAILRNIEVCYYKSLTEPERRKIAKQATVVETYFESAITRVSVVIDYGRDKRDAIEK